MGRTVTPKYRLDVVCNVGTLGLTWDGRLGTPTEARLAAWVDTFNASLRPGGVNAHLGASHVSRATVRRNVPGGAAVAAYRAPLFMVI